MYGPLCVLRGSDASSVSNLRLPEICQFRPLRFSFFCCADVWGATSTSGMTARPVAKSASMMSVSRGFNENVLTPDRFSVFFCSQLLHGRPLPPARAFYFGQVYAAT